MERYFPSDHLLSLDEQDKFSDILTGERSVNFQENFLLVCFQDATIGRLVRGIVHNMNGFIQILSMQIELCKMDIERDLEAIHSKDLDGLSSNLDKRKERLLQMEKVLAKIEYMINIIACRSQNGGRGQRLLALDQILKEELAFWNADLFFKHSVKKETDLSGAPCLNIVNENQLRDMIDSLLSACIEEIRRDGKGNLRVSLRQKEESNAWQLDFEHTGKDFPIGMDLSGVEVWKDPHNSLLVLALNLARVRARQIGASIRLDPKRVSCLIPDNYTKAAS